MSDYMYRPPVIDSIIPFLSNTEYGLLLTTCKEIKSEFDGKITSIDVEDGTPVELGKK